MPSSSTSNPATHCIPRRFIGIPRWTESCTPRDRSIVSCRPTPATGQGEEEEDSPQRHKGHKDRHKVIQLKKEIHRGGRGGRGERERQERASEEIGTVEKIV